MQEINEIMGKEINGIVHTWRKGVKPEEIGRSLDRDSNYEI